METMTHDSKQEELVGFFDETPYHNPHIHNTSNNNPSNIKTKKRKIESVRDLLLKSVNEAQKKAEIDAAKQDEDTPALLLQPEIGGGGGKVDTVFGQELTPEQQELLKEKLAQKQKQLQDLEKRMRAKAAKKIQAIHPYVTDEEVEYALRECNNDEEEVCVYLTDYTNLQFLRKQIALEHHRINGTSPMGEEDEKDEDEIRAVITRKRRRQGPGKRADQNKKPFERIRLDEALKRENFEGWSEARIHAYKLKDKNPNAYYYRFNDPGEKQKEGPWTKDEIALFFKRMKEVGVNGQWGVFSRAIPGRVGYQCSNFYRHLIETGQVEDPNYYLDEKGKAHFVFKRGRRRQNQGDGSGNTTDTADAKPKIKRKSKKKKKRSDDDDDGAVDDDADDEEYRPSAYRRGGEDEEESDSGKQGKQYDNPLPGLIDPITGCEVERPAISPYGHVLSYATWSRCLSLENSRNICPLTKKPLKKRDLVILTWENINEYKDKIVDIQKL